MINTIGPAVKAFQLYKTLFHFFFSFLCDTEDTHRDNFGILVVLRGIVLKIGLRWLVVYSFFLLASIFSRSSEQKTNKSISKNV